MSRNLVESLDTAGSYRWFARSKVVMEEADLPALRWAIQEKVHKVADIGSGPAVVVEHLIKEGILQDPFTALAVDPDRHELRVGRKDLMDYQTYENYIHFIQAVAEHIPLTDRSQELVTCLNTIHLTDAKETIAEMYRIAQPGASILITTAYDPDYGYLRDECEDDEIHKLWQLPAKKALKYLMKQGLRPESAVRPDGYREEELKEMLENVGFDYVQSMRKRVEFDEEAFKNIHIYDGYASNVFPGVDIRKAREALTYGCEEVFKANPVRTYPRGYVYLKATRPFRAYTSLPKS